MSRPGNMRMELGYIERFGRDLSNSFDFDPSPYRQLLNIFNHVNFFDPSLNLLNSASFGVSSTELIPADRTPGQPVD